MADARLKEYAALLTDHCLQVRTGDQIVIDTSPTAVPLLEELFRVISLRGGHIIPLVTSGSMKRASVELLPDEQLEQSPPLMRSILQQCDAILLMQAPDNTRTAASIDARRMALSNRNRARMLTRFMNMEARWVVCLYPTFGMAQDAEMSLEEYEEFVYGACLLDWSQATDLMARVKARFDSGSNVRIVGAGTDLRFSLQGRTGTVDDGRCNMPGGEVFYAPVEESVEGTITYDFPAVMGGREANGIRLTFRNGRVVEASATSGEDFLLKTLDTDAGARVLGEFGIGCNYGIERFSRNILFDEKMGGTLHLAVGNAYPLGGGKNKSAVHWDMLKDMRSEGQMWLDGVLVQESGRFIGI